MNRDISSLSETRLKMYRVLRLVLSSVFKFIIPTILIMVGYDLYNNIDGTNINILFIMALVVIGIIAINYLRKEINKYDSLVDNDAGFSISVTRRVLSVLVTITIPVAILIATTIGTSMVIEMINGSVESFIDVITKLSNTIINCVFSFTIGVVINVWLKPYEDLNKIDEAVTLDNRKTKRTKNKI